MFDLREKNETEFIAFCMICIALIITRIPGDGYSHSDTLLLYYRTHDVLR